MRRYILPIVIEIFGIGIVATGIGYEVATGAHLGFVIICIGSWLIAAGGIIWGKFARYHDIH